MVETNTNHMSIQLPTIEDENLNTQGLVERGQKLFTTKYGWIQSKFGRGNKDNIQTV